MPLQNAKICSCMGTTLTWNDGTECILSPDSTQFLFRSSSSEKYALHTTARPLVSQRSFVIEAVRFRNAHTDQPLHLPTLDGVVEESKQFISKSRFSAFQWPMVPKFGEDIQVVSAEGLCVFNLASSTFFSVAFPVELGQCGDEWLYAWSEQYHSTFDCPPMWRVPLNLCLEELSRRLSTTVEELMSLPSKLLPKNDDSPSMYTCPLPTMVHIGPNGTAATQCRDWLMRHGGPEWSVHNESVTPCTTLFLWTDSCVVASIDKCAVACHSEASGCACAWQSGDRVFCAYRQNDGAKWGDECVVSSAGEIPRGVGNNDVQRGVMVHAAKLVTNNKAVSISTPATRTGLDELVFMENAAFQHCRDGVGTFVLHDDGRVSCQFDDGATGSLDWTGSSCDIVTSTGYRVKGSVETALADDMPSVAYVQNLLEFRRWSKNNDVHSDRDEAVAIALSRTNRYLACENIQSGSGQVEIPTVANVDDVTAVRLQQLIRRMQERNTQYLETIL